MNGNALFTAICDVVEGDFVDIFFYRFLNAAVALGQNPILMRGEKVFKELFNKQNAERIPKGRNANLLARRNHCLLDRYFYYGHYTDKRYETILENLCTEFFLSERTVREIIDAHDTYLLEMKTKKPILSFLEMRWPHLKW